MRLPTFGALAIVAPMADRIRTIPAETRKRVAAAGGAKRAETLPAADRSAIARLGAEAANRPSRLAARIANGWKGTPLAEKRRVAAELARLPKFAELITKAVELNGVFPDDEPEGGVSALVAP
jgi:acyl-CoA reductase-like NAD-dependent aldehyde dehydrogenase